ncbi:MAG: Smr/MutS family protein [Deltaproteobacteria bacterium]|nr:Smr/MutS family protein [Deltaproteobacteria bacterium]
MDNNNIKASDEIIELLIDGVIDLHTFLPEEAADVVDEYIYACAEKGVYEVRIIQGKGKGVLRRVVHSLLEKHPLVAGFNLDSGGSGWGATIARLKREPG